MEQVANKGGLSFKDRYANPEFKQKHLAYVLEKIDCEVCNCKFGRCKRTVHERTQKHQQNLLIQQLRNK